MSTSRSSQDGQPMVNRNRLSNDESYKALERNLHSCISMKDREYINRSGQYCKFVEFVFPNGTRDMSIANSPQVDALLNDFMHAQGVFKKASESLTKD